MNHAGGGVEAAFAQRAATYDADTWHVRYAERLVELAALTPGLRVLDAATGTGHAAIAAARAVGPAGKVVGVDLSEAMLTRAREAVATAGLTNVELVKADATELGAFKDGSFEDGLFEDGSFDVVLCSAGLLYMPVQAALGEWRRLLTPGGRVGFSSMREGFPLAGVLFRELARGFGLDLSDPAAPLGSVDRCRQAMRQAGLTPTDQFIEPIAFGRTDLDRAWDAHINGSQHAAVVALAPDRLQTFHADYLRALAELLRVNEAGVLHPEVIYAFARTPLNARKSGPAAKRGRL
jgi:ubiquinone/menaquinone biosynthesis C-methylase UbiE